MSTNLNEFKDIVKAEASIKNKLVMDIMKKDRTEEETLLVIQGIRDLILQNGADMRLRITSNDRAIYIAHTIDIVLGMIAKTWIDISDLKMDTPEEVLAVQATIVERSMNVYNDNVAMTKNIEDIQLTIVEILNRSKKEDPIDSRYALLFDSIDYTAMKYIQFAASHIHAMMCNEEGNPLSGDVNKDIANIIVVDNIFSDITIFDVGDADVD